MQAGLPSLPFAGASFDTVVCTLVLCSVDDQAAALTEIARVLAPGGRLLFLEHVRAPDNPRLARLQDLVDRPHRLLAAGCRPNRRTEEALAASPLSVEWLVRGVPAERAGDRATDDHGVGSGPLVLCKSAGRQTRSLPRQARFRHDAGARPR